MAEIVIPGIRYRQGRRTMYVAADDPTSFLSVLEPRREYDPRSPHQTGNRPIDKQHLAGIVDYLETEPEYVIGAAVLYVKPGEISFIAQGDRGDRPTLGMLSIPIGAKFWQGDGQHRFAGYSAVLSRHEHDEHDPVYVRLKQSATPAIIVEESRPAKIAQDFVDLQRNAKPLSSSLGAALDRRRAISRLALDVAQTAPFLKYTAEGKDNEAGGRLEYLTQTVSLNSPALYTFGSWRFAVGTIVIGFGPRSRSGWEKETERVLSSETEYSGWSERLVAIFNQAAEDLPYWRAITGGAEPKALRQSDVLGSAAGLNAFAGALNAVMAKGRDPMPAIRKMGKLNWQREPGAFFDGTLLQPPLSKDQNQVRLVAGRTGYEAAAQQLVRELTPRAAVA